MNYVDLFLAALILIMVGAGYARGFVLSLLSLVRFGVSVPLAFYAAKNYSEKIYVDYFRAKISETVIKKIESGSVNEYINSLKDSFNSLPDAIKNSADFLAINNSDAHTAAEQIMNNIIDPAAKIVFEILIFILTILTIYVITWIVTILIKKIINGKDSPIKKTDKFLGALLGALKAAIAVVAISAVGFYITENVSASGGFVDLMKTSVVIEFVNKFNPLINF